MKAVISLIGFYQVSVVNVSQSRLLVRFFQCINYIVSLQKQAVVIAGHCNWTSDRIDFWASVARVASKYLTEEPRRKSGF